MDGQIPFRVHMVQRQLHHLSNPILVHLVHRERLDPVLLQNPLFPGVDVAQTDVDDLVRFELRLDPGELWDGRAEPEEEGDGHAVDVACVGCFGGVDVGVGIDPDHACVRVLAGREGNG